MERQEAINILKKYLACRDHYDSDTCPNITVCPHCEFYVETDILDKVIETLWSTNMKEERKHNY